VKIEKYMGAAPSLLIGSVLRCMLKDISYRIEDKNKDCFILIVAALGDGKSTLGAEICSYMDPSFNADRTIFRDYHYYKLKRDLTKGYDPIKTPRLCKKKGLLFDEIKRYLLAKESMKPEAVELEKDLNDVRSLGFFMVGCVDDLKSATRWIRESRVQIIIYIPKAGECWIYKLYKGEGDDEGSEIVIQEIKKRLLNGEHPYTPYRSTFKPIPVISPYWKDYSRRKAKYQINSESTQSKELLLELQDRSEAVMKDYLNIRDAAKFLMITRQSLHNYKFQHKIKAIKTIKGLYFHKRELEKAYFRLYGIRPLSLCVYKKDREKNAN